MRHTFGVEGFAWNQSAHLAEIRRLQPWRGQGDGRIPTGIRKRTLWTRWHSWILP